MYFVFVRERINSLFPFNMYIKNREVEIDNTSYSHITSWQSQSLGNRSPNKVEVSSYQNIYSTDIYSPNFWQHMFNTNIYFNKSIFPNTAPEGRPETPTIHPAPKCWPDIFNAHICVQLTFFPQIVGCIYPRRPCVVKELSRPIYMCIHAF